MADYKKLHKLVANIKYDFHKTWATQEGCDFDPPELLAGYQVASSTYVGTRANLKWVCWSELEWVTSKIGIL